LSNLLTHRREKLEEARMMNLHAIQLDRGNVYYRINAGTVLMAMGKYDEAVAVLKNAFVLAKDPSENRLIQINLDTAQRMREAGTHTNFTTTVISGEPATLASRTVVEAEVKPKHPVEDSNGAKHEVLGVIRHVECSYPSVMDFMLEGTKKSVALYTNNYYKVDVSALGFEPKKEMNMCHDIEGMKARVEYADSSDKSVDGQVLSIELRE